MACERRPSGACQGAADCCHICCQDVCCRVWPNVARICVLRGVGRFREIRQRRSHFVGRRGEEAARVRKLDRTVVGGGANAALTVGLRADEAGGGAVKEGEKASHSEADVGVSWPQVQGGEARDLDLQNVLRSHLDVWDLQGHGDRTYVLALELQQHLYAILFMH